MIAINNLQKRFGRLWALRNLNLTIHKGRVTAIIGPNSSGKSTLLKIILGLVSPTAGDLQLNGVSMNGSGDYRKFIGYMPQLPKFPDHLKVSEVLDLVEDVRGTKRKKQDYLIELFQLGSELDKRIRTLSGGTKQKLSAMIALMFEPEVLILDEPTAGLDPISSRSFKSMLVDLSQEGKTVVITSHIMSEIEELADDIVVLCEGRTFYSGSSQRLKKQTGESNLGDAVSAIMKDSNK